MDSRAQITIYGTESCCYCTAARTLLENKGLSYKNITVTGDAASYQQMMQRSGSRQVPQIFINDRSIGGFDELYMLELSGELDRLINQE